MKKINCLVSILCLFLYSCSDDTDKTLSLSENNVEFASIGGEQQISVYSNTEWEVKYDVDWLNAETGRNMSSGSIIITAQTNYLTTERNAEIIVTTPSGEIMEKITISQKGQIDSKYSQVYDRDWTPFEGNIEIIGRPAIGGSFDSPGHFPSSTISFENRSFLNGEVKDGIMNINFPTDKIELSSEYKSLTSDLTMAQMFIEQENSSSRKFGLYKKADQIDNRAYISDNRVYILYVDEDFSNELVTLKAGWNFIEIYDNPNWEYGSNEPYQLIGIISQDVNTFLEKGYRWKIEFWV